MNVKLERIEAFDEQRITHRVTLTVDGETRTFSVHAEPARAIRGMSAVSFSTDDLLTELLRFEPGALHMLYTAVGQHRRGRSPALPITLVESSVPPLGAPTEASG